MARRTKRSAFHFWLLTTFLIFCGLETGCYKIDEPPRSAPASLPASEAKVDPPQAPGSAAPDERLVTTPVVPPSLAAKISGATPREWVDSTGKYRVTATLNGVSADHITLAKQSGELRDVPLALLSSSDRQWLVDQQYLARSTKFIEVTVLRVSDGDRAVVQDVDKRLINVQLEGIDAPESKQSYFRQSKNALDEKIVDQRVLISWNKQDNDGRILGHVYLGKRWINHEMVADGWAWHFKEQLNDSDLATAEAEARKAHRGLWAADSEPDSPWAFRESERLERRNKEQEKLQAVANARSTLREKAKDREASERPVYSPPLTYSGGSSASSSSPKTVHVKGYFRKNGTYVQPHTRSAPRRR